MVDICFGNWWDVLFDNTTKDLPTDYGERYGKYKNEIINTLLNEDIETETREEAETNCIIKSNQYSYISQIFNFNACKNIKISMPVYLADDLYNNFLFCSEKCSAEFFYSEDKLLTGRLCKCPSDANINTVKVAL